MPAAGHMFGDVAKGCQVQRTCGRMAVSHPPPSSTLDTSTAKVSNTSIASSSIAVQVAHTGTHATVRNSHVQLASFSTQRALAIGTSNSPAKMVACSCSNGARLELDQCTIDMTASQQEPAAGSAEGSSGRRQAPAAQLQVMGVVVADPEGAHPSKRPASVSMTDCQFSMRVPAGRVVGKAVALDEKGTLQAARCTFVGWGLAIQSKRAALLSDCVIQDVQAPAAGMGSRMM